jgi:glucose-6-phosphate isomerase
MLDLEKVSGLPLGLAEDYQLAARPPMAEAKRTFARKFSEMQPVLLDPAARPEPMRDEMYFVYRNLYLPEDRGLILEHHLTYDVTILPPGRIGREFNKTVGHYHGNIPGKQIAHPELYQILHGSALFLLQKMDPEFNQVISVIAFEASTGDKVVYPPNYGHVMINIGSEPLVTANWLCTDYHPLYEPVADRSGLAYYVVAGKQNKYEFAANPRYPNAPAVRIIDQKFMNNFPITGPKPMYTAGVANPQQLEFLSRPEKYAVELSSITS